MYMFQGPTFSMFVHTCAYPLKVKVRNVINKIFQRNTGIIASKVQLRSKFFFDSFRAQFSYSMFRWFQGPIHSAG